MSGSRESCIPWDGAAPEEVAQLQGLIERSIYRTAGRYSVALQPSEVEDIAQETLLALWLRGEGYSPNCVKSYVSQAARNRTIDALRQRGAKKRGEKDTIALEDAAQFVCESRSPEENLLARQELADQLHRCKAILTRKSFETLLIVYLEGLDSGEAARRLHCSRSSVDTVVHRARLALAQHGIELQPRPRS